MTRRQKYKFVKVEYSKKGKISIVISGVSLLLFLISVIVSFAFRGAAGMLVGGIGLFTMLISFFGFFVAVKGYSDKDCDHKLCTIGALANGLICILYLALFSVGVA